MCGIVGAFPLNKPGLEMDPQTRRLVLLYLHNETLFETVARGKDATGMALSFGPREEGGAPYWAVLKQPVRTCDFFINDGSSSRYKGQDDEANIERYMDVACLLTRPLKHVLGHTRAKTQGSEFNPLNNHPILVNDIIGIHNGGVRNDDVIYKKHPEMTPQGEVDSEALVQLLALSGAGRMLGAEDIKYVTERIEGPRAVMAYNRHHPDQVIYFHDKERPLEMVYIQELATVFLCSERRFFDQALALYERLRLTLKRDLPALSWEWRNIPAGKGGVINVAEEIDDTQKVEDMFPLLDCANTLSEYEVTKSYTTGGRNYSYQNGSNRNTGGSTGSTGTSSKGTNDTKPKKQLGPAPQAAEIIDLSQFGAENKGQTHSVDAEVLMDDNEDNNTEESEDDNVLDLYADEELKMRGIEYALSEESKDDEDLMVNLHKGNYKGLLAQTSLTEDAAAEVVHQLFPEFHGEGYVRGFKDGVEEQAAANEDESENIITAVQEMEGELEQLRTRLAAEKTKQRKAANFIANMKSFLVAAIVTHQLGQVVEEDGKSNLVFDDELEEFIDIATGFENVDLGRVRNLFSPKDLEILKEGFYNFAKKVSQENEEHLEPVDSLSIKTITS